MKKIIFLFIAAGLSFSLYAQKMAIKNNLIYDAVLSPNLSVEMGINKQLTLDISGNVNPMETSSTEYFKHWLVQPEIRYWFCERFNGTFVGFHLMGGGFDIAGSMYPLNSFKTFQDHRYNGYFWGGGLSIGHQWILGDRWGIEALIGGGYAHLYQEKYECRECTNLISKKYKDFLGPTKVSLSIVYMIR